MSLFRKSNMKINFNILKMSAICYNNSNSKHKPFEWLLRSEKESMVNIAFLWASSDQATIELLGNKDGIINRNAYFCK